MIGRSLAWIASAGVVMVVAWGATTSIGGVLFLERPASGLVADAAAAAMWAAMLAPSLVVVYGIPIVLWPRVLRRLPRVERDLRHLALGVAAMTLPAALLVGSAYAPSPPFLLAFTCAFVTGWLALFLPRAIVPSLAPGAFRPAATDPLSLHLGG